MTTDGKSHDVYAFRQGTDGRYPNSNVLDVNGVLYGTTFLGGTHDLGTVFSVTASGKERVLYSFAGSPDGADPFGNLIDVNGTLYGTTTGGGTDKHGTVFSITTSGEERVLHSFLGSPDGAVPYGGVIAVNGMLYGVTTEGGSNYSPIGYGTVYSISMTGKNERVLYSFAGKPDAEVPYGSLIDVDGTLYGTTYLGGSGPCEFGCGAVFALKP